ncbi:MAG: type II toxin-antitoxin system VapC family toxin [Bauldia sp.]|nr:type II toxin-antitoxin system VapC family toxin [Bauldia sp.]
MIGIDTNVLLRLFSDDNPAQAASAANLIDAQGPESIRVSNIVLAEMVWALARIYRQDKARIIEILVLLLGREELVFEFRSAVKTALDWYEHGRADFADYLIAASNAAAGAEPTYTFDQMAESHPAFAPVPMEP